MNPHQLKSKQKHNGQKNKQNISHQVQLNFDWGKKTSKYLFLNCFKTLPPGGHFSEKRGGNKYNLLGRGGITAAANWGQLWTVPCCVTPVPGCCGSATVREALRTARGTSGGGCPGTDPGRSRRIRRCMEGRWSSLEEKDWIK